MHTELGGNLGDGEPPRTVEMLSQTPDFVGCPDVANPESGEGLPGPRPQPSPVQGVRDLLIRLLGGQCPHHLDDSRRRPPKIRRAPWDRAFEGGRRPTFPPNVQMNHAVAEERDIFDQQPQHALALACRRPRIVPHPREVGDQGLNPLAVVTAELMPIGLRHARVFVLERREPGEFLIPLLLERIGDEPMLRTHEHELALGKLGFFASTLDLRPMQAIDLSLAPAELIEDLQRHIERRWRHGLENDLTHGLVQTGAGDDLTRRRRGLDPPPPADVL
jgi:hypothetical protein